jgi:hypothetical protein
MRSQSADVHVAVTSRDANKAAFPHNDMKDTWLLNMYETGQ